MTTSYSIVPQRTCVGCGERAAQNELIRFSVRAGKLCFGESKTGRGAYLHQAQSCWESAVRRNAFSRSFRAAIDTTEIEFNRILHAQGA